MNSLSNTLTKNIEETTVWTKLFLDTMSKVRKGSIVIKTSDGDFFNFRGPENGEDVTIVIHSWKFAEELFMKGDIGLGEAYIDGHWDCEHINKLINFGIQNKSEFEKIIRGSFLKILFYRAKHLLNRNSKKGSEKNIHAHYDIGNSFYSLWLDPSMTYSSAIILDENEDLQLAQMRKYQSVLDKLNLKSGDHILEVGCGWGGFLEYAANKGIKVTGVTISREQYDFACKRLANFTDLVDVKYQDYRDINGKYDHVVSIEMFEALGEQYWQQYFSKLYSLLKPGGKLVVQSITINNKDFKTYRKGTDFIQQYIFPGGMLPSPEVFKVTSQKVGFIYENEMSFGLDYAITLKKWEEAYLLQLDKIKSLGFDNKFLRTWSFYLKYCQGAFEAEQISVYHFQLTKN